MLRKETKISRKETISLRENVIGYIYSYELLERKLESNDAFEAGNFTDKEIKYIDKISLNYDVFKKLITQFTKKSWPWGRISVINRAVLIYGTFELSFNDKSLVIDVLIKYAKEFIPDDSYKFINSILDKIGGYFEKLKNDKKVS